VQNKYKTKIQEGLFIKTLAGSEPLSVKESKMSPIVVAGALEKKNAQYLNACLNQAEANRSL
jgi:hypothetical protein